MKSMSTQHLVKVLAALGGATTIILGACSLGLDASKLTALEEAGVGVTDAGGDGAVEVPPGATRCSNDGQCNDGGCYAGRCSDGVCQFELCPTTNFACNHSSCVGTTCSANVPHKFVAQHMTLGRAGLGCGGALGACTAIVYPFAFVAPQTGDVAAYPIVDFTVSDAGAFAPAAVKISNVDFTIARMIASGDRLWLMGSPVLKGSSTQVPLAWLDVPVDPSLSVLEATVGTVTLPSQNSTISAVFRGADKGLIVLLSDPSSTLPRATQVKVEDGGVNTDPTFSAIGSYDGGAAFVQSSGDRLITAHPLAGPPNAVYNVEIIKNAGASNAVSLGEKDLTAAIAPGIMFPNVAFAGTPQGGVLAQAPYALLDGDGGVVGVDGVRVAWFIEQADDTQIEGKGVVQVLGLNGAPGPDPTLIGPIAAIAEDTAISMLLEGDAGTHVRVVKRDLTAGTASVQSDSDAVLDQPPQAFVLRGAQSAFTGRSYGYAFSRPANDADGVKLTIFEVGCGQ